MSNLTLSKIQDKKVALEKDLVDIEKAIADLERTYLESTSYGNVVKGWEGYLNVNLKHTARTVKVVPKDQIFSSSSTTAPAEDEANRTHTQMQDDSESSNYSD